MTPNCHNSTLTSLYIAIAGSRKMSGNNRITKPTLPPYRSLQNWSLQHIRLPIPLNPRLQATNSHQLHDSIPPHCHCRVPENEREQSDHQAYTPSVYTAYKIGASNTSDYQFHSKPHCNQQILTGYTLPSLHIALAAFPKNEGRIGSPSLLPPYTQPTKLEPLTHATSNSTQPRISSNKLSPTTQCHHSTLPCPDPTL